MAITPSTDLYLLKCPIELDNDNQINFATATAQANYFLSLPKIEVEDISYQRKDSIIRYPAHIDTLLGFNYVMYRNDNYSNKWFYAFITDMTYLNDGCTAIKIKTDVWQTWCFDLTFKQSFVEREHVSNDAVGAHTIPEGLEYGEYICNAYQNLAIDASPSNSYLGIQVSQLASSMYSTLGNASRIYGGLPQGCWLLVLELADATTAYTNLNNLIRTYDEENLADAIVSIGIIPKNLTGQVVIFSFDTTHSFDAGALPASNSATTIASYSVTRNSTVNGYTPKNNKLLCSPYNYLLVSNNGGADVSYAWEDFSSSSASFSARGIVSQGCDIKLTPSNYKSTDLTGGYEWSIPAQKLPMVSWNSDYYLNWQAVNGKNMEIQAGLTGASFAGNLLGGMFSGNIGQMFNAGTSVVSNTANIMQQIREAEMTPNQARGNANTGSLNYSLSKSGFTAYKMSIKSEYAQAIDSFFEMYGYKVNMKKVPQYSSRRYWNYVKTVQANIEGDIPQNDMQEIKGLFNNGITMWHDPANFLNYNLSNTIV